MPSAAALALLLVIFRSAEAPPPPRPAAAAAAPVPSAAIAIAPVRESRATSVEDSSPPVIVRRSVPAARPLARPVREDELALLWRTKQALATGDLDDAGRTLAERERLYARDGTLNDEAAVLRIELLVARGEKDAARTEADRLLERHPDSAFERRVRALVH